ncbi:MAG: hypothetical protein SAJ12_03060 [Jaaginema sp. PMC 1079.18]|nr:hypothetical protein [Jaaginema sp. PMC 1080.18]MEC4849967.1 hypothetical protein [Jaaginema sp. PMC 1079.18]MEC4866938.1 hypothetical protein [Jaaginema sp. PMC 1078.18]
MNSSILYKTVGVVLLLTVGCAITAFSNFRTGAIALVFLGCTVFSFLYPRYSLWLLLLYMPFSGTVIYSALGEGHPLYHLVIDTLYFPATIALTRKRGLVRDFLQQVRPLLPIFATLILLCCLTLVFVNSTQPYTTGNNPLLIGLLGFKVLVGHVPLIFCGYYLIVTEDDLLTFNRLQVAIVIICCSLLLVQYRLLVTGICSGSIGLYEYALNKATLDARCLVGGSLLYNPEWDLIRLPGTFVSPWQWGWFLISGAFLTYACYTSDTTHRWRFVSAIAMVYVAIATLISGQRVAVVLVPIVWLVLVFLTDSRRRWIPLKLAISSFLAVSLASQFINIQDPIKSLIERWQASPPYLFIVEQFDWIINQKEGWLGNGLGRGTNAVRVFGNMTSLGTDYANIETFYAKLLYEIGLLGMLTFLILVSILVWLTWKAYRSLTQPHLKRLGICFWVFVVMISYNTFYYPLDVDPVAVYYWLLAGILLKLPQLDRKQPLRDELFCDFEAKKRNFWWYK